jgi:hypothetical protein
LISSDLMDRMVSASYIAIMTKDATTDEFDVLRSIVDQLKGLGPDDQRRVIKWACEKLGIDAPSGSSSTTPHTPAATPSHPHMLATVANIKSFVDEKTPLSDMHFATVVAYFHRFMAAEKKDAIGAEDLQEATRLVGRQRLQNPGQTMINASSSGLLDKVGRGLYRVNTVGENLVALVLPGDGKASPVASRRPKPPKRKSSARKK